MPTPTIPAGNLFMNATIYTGDNTTPKSITNGVAGQAFQPDFVWIKSRSNAYQNNLYDSVRGAGSAYALSSDQTAAEGGNSNVYGYLSAFNANGFAVTQGTAGGGGAPNGNAYTNQSSSTYVGWQWKAGGTAVSNTAGTITSQVSANTTSGFSVVGWTGTGSVGTIGHGLGVTPSMIIGKRRDGTSNWFVYHASLGATAGMNINTTDAALTNSGWWNNTAPTSSVFTMGSYETNSGSPFIAYCWAPIAGYSAFGSYTGNGSTDGPFVYLGFRPKFILIKNVSRVVSWYVEDSVRNTYNVMGLDLNPNTAGAESNDAPVLDFVSNGFKIRNTYDAFNQSGETLIYMAFAETPLKFSNAR